LFCTSPIYPFMQGMYHGYEEDMQISNKTGLL
jgi:hypothetical protein